MPGKSIYSWLVCAGLCTKQWKNSECLFNSHLCRFFSAGHHIHSLPCSVPWRPTLPAMPPSSLPTCLPEALAGDQRGKEREVCIFRDSCASPPWRFPSCSLKPSGPPSPPLLIRGCHGFTLLLAQEPQLQPQSVKGPSIKCSPFVPSGVNSVFCWDPDEYTYCFFFFSCYYQCSIRLEFPFLKINSQPLSLFYPLGIKEAANQ